MSIPSDAPASVRRAADSDVAFVEHLLASGSLVAAQQPSPCRWSPERRLAGTVLAAALVEVREHHSQEAYRRAIDQDLEWIFSDEQDWPFSFIRLCHDFAVEPEYVRDLVRSWLRSHRPTPARGNRTTPRGEDGTRAFAVRHASA